MRKSRVFSTSATAFFLLGLLGFLIEISRACNESVCGVVVSKCLLTKSCSCDLKYRSCSSLCFKCLGSLYVECCDCVEMCTKSKGDFDVLDKASYVEDLLDPVPGLFQALIDQPDSTNSFVSETFLIHLNLTKKGVDLAKKPEYEIAAVNCSVVFWSQCMVYGKCRQSCLTMGSSSFRLFHNGCCECIGTNCIDYGINESRCTQCPMNDDTFDYVDENDLNYDEDDDEDDDNVLDD